ncbi:MAG: arginase [Deltaproteobacteria bacterium RBG_16_71_12]|nr:MAG: arginase [Deltaproteobacteria bacterium RBG_16_71_12]
MSPLDELKLLLRPAGGGLYLVSTGRADQQALQRRFYAVDSDEDVTRAFHEVLACIADAKVVMLGIPSDVGAGFRRGANLGPQAIRTELLAKTPEWATDNLQRGVIDIGDVFVVPQLLEDEMLAEAQLQRTRRALYPDVPEAERAALPCSPLSIAERALTLVQRINPRAKPLVLGGDHSVAWPVVKALFDGGKRFAVVQADAHTDLLEERLGIRTCFATWTWRANELLGRSGRVLQVGIRATRFPKEHWEGTLGVRQWWARDVRRDPDAALRELLAAARGLGTPVYLSNDIDGTDAADADATGTPEPDGLAADWLCTLIDELGRAPGLIGADLVEVAPLLGKDGGRRTLEVGARYLRHTVDALLH